MRARRKIERLLYDYCFGIDSGDFASTAALFGDDGLYGLVGGPAARGSAQVLGMIDRLLAEAGSSKSRILMAQIFLADLADFPGMNRVWDAWVPQGNSPPRATVQALLANPAFRIEVVITAAQ